MDVTGFFPITPVMRTSPCRLRDEFFGMAVRKRLNHPCLAALRRYSPTLCCAVWSVVAVRHVKVACGRGNFGLPGNTGTPRQDASLTRFTNGSRKLNRVPRGRWLPTGGCRKTNDACASGGRNDRWLVGGNPTSLLGQVAEWSKAHAWNACRRATVSRVRIPLCPPATVFAEIR